MLEVLKKIWDDQRDFNRTFWAPPRTWEDRSTQTKEFAIHMISELDELLRKTAWKKHRNRQPLENWPAVKEELTDVFKYFISMCQVWNVEPAELMELYWTKSMVCRQRYSEEFLLDFNSPVAVIDIDNVLANYSLGIVTWLRGKLPEASHEQLKTILDQRRYVTASALDVSPELWEALHHEYRLSDAHLYLPVMPGASDFLYYLRERGLRIVLLTSRPIDQYPGIYTDTLGWLRKNNLLFDVIWWSHNKGDKIVLEGIRERVRFVLDDDERFIKQVERLGILSVWFRPDWNVADAVETLSSSKHRVLAENFGEVIEMIERRKLYELP